MPTQGDDVAHERAGPAALLLGDRGDGRALTGFDPEPLHASHTLGTHYIVVLRAPKRRDLTPRGIHVDSQRCDWRGFKGPQGGSTGDDVHNRIP